jgi:outer membrane protein OmpA-like peptidoglycan-associated protein
MKGFQFITKLLVSLSCLAVLCTANLAQAQDKPKEVTINGPIVSRDGEMMVVRSDAGGEVKITLTKTTKVQLVKGLIGIRKEEMSMAALVPGLRVKVDAEPKGEQTIAKSIKFSPDDLKRASDIQAALAVPQLQIKESKEEIEKGKEADAAIAKRLSDLKEYDVKGEITVLFDVNSAKLSDKAKADLKALAEKAKPIKGYLIQVVGYTDSTGGADYNQALSDRRAESVTAYLRKSCGVQISRVLAPAAMGMSRPVATNETKEGKADNRRVEVKILLNRGMHE